MLCLHGKPDVTSTTENGTFWFCGEPCRCDFICSDEQAYLYEEAIKAFLATKQNRPACCRIGTSEEYNYARLRVVRDAEKESFGRPFFTCSKENDRCNYFEWGDEIITPKPLCKHGKRSKLQKVKKEGPTNKGWSFLCCPEPRNESCKFFRWYEAPKPKEPEENPFKWPETQSPVEPSVEDPLEPFTTVLFTNPTSYRYTIKKTGVTFNSSETDRKKAYEEFLQTTHPIYNYTTNKEIDDNETPLSPLQTTPKKSNKEIDDNETPPSPPAKKRPTTSCSETFQMPPDFQMPSACKKGICGHFECYDRCTERMRGILQGSSLF